VFALVILLAPVFSVRSALGTPKNDDFTEVYAHTYDEVFQAVQEAIERRGHFITEKDKDKGTITGHGTPAVLGTMRRRVDFTLRVETISAQPQTRVTIELKVRMLAGEYRKNFVREIFSETQKVLATYR
jgi:hypothetical protein